MPIHNVLAFFASPVVFISSVVSLTCVGVLAVNIDSGSDYPDEIETSSNYSRPAVQHRDEAGDRFSSQVLRENSVHQQTDGVNKARAVLDRKGSVRHASTSPQKKKVKDVRQKKEHSPYNKDERSLKASISEDYYSNSKEANHIDMPGYWNNSASTNSTVSSNISSTASDVTESISISSSTTSTNTSSDVSLDSDPEITPPEAIPEPEEKFCNVSPATTEHTVQIDMDETQTISCRVIEQCGAPCMCTMTISDANGVISEETIDNCG